MTRPPEAITAAFEMWFPESGIPDQEWNHNIAYEAFCSGAAAERDRIRQPEIAEDGSRFCQVCGADLPGEPS